MERACSNGFVTPRGTGQGRAPGRPQAEYRQLCRLPKPRSEGTTRRLGRGYSQRAMQELERAFGCTSSTGRLRRVLLHPPYADELRAWHEFGWRAAPDPAAIARE